MSQRNHVCSRRGEVAGNPYSVCHDCPLALRVRLPEGRYQFGLLFVQVDQELSLLPQLLISAFAEQKLFLSVAQNLGKHRHHLPWWDDIPGLPALYGLAGEAISLFSSI